MNGLPRRQLALLVMVALLGGCQAQKSDTADQSADAAARVTVETNKAACQRFYDLALGQADTSAVDALVAADAIDHQQMPPGYPSGTAVALKRFILDWHAGFPDIKVKVVSMVGEGDHVAIYSTMTGTNTGAFMGMKPTGKAVTVEGFDLVRFENGKMVEHWGLNDNYGMMLQMGLIKEPGAK